MTDSTGHTVDFKNTVIIMTSNIGTRGSGKGPIGIQASEGGGKVRESNKTEEEYIHMKDKIMDEFKKTVTPEFFNRLDAIIVFRILTREENKKILDIVLDQVNKRLASKGLSLILSERSRDFLLDHGFDKNLGARPLKRAIQKYVEDPLATELLQGRFTEGHKIYVDAESDHLTFQLEEREKAQV